MKNYEMVNEYLQSLALENHKLDFEFLRNAVTGHVRTYAFSSVACWLGDELPLDFNSLFNRIIAKRRGGYCFEHNGLFYNILQELGFDVQLYLARVIYNQDIHSGLTHRITMTKYDGDAYVLDVGFGSLGPRIPVPMSGAEVHDGEKVFRITEINPGEYHMQVLKNGAFFSLYRFELARYGQSDCILGHFYSSQHPDAVFVNNLVSSLILEHETRSLRNLEYWIIKSSDTEVQTVNSSEKLWQIITGEFGIQISQKESTHLYKRLTT